MEKHSLALPVAVLLSVVGFECCMVVVSGPLAGQGEVFQGGASELCLWSSQAGRACLSTELHVVNWSLSGHGGAGGDAGARDQMQAQRC